MNPKPTLIVITSYPEKGIVHSAHTVGVASYSKNLLQSIKTQYPQLQIIVLAERLAACQQCEYLDNGIIVRRCWRRNHPASLQKIAAICAQIPQGKILLSLEINMFGSKYATWKTLQSLAQLKKKSRSVTTILHQVMGDFHQLGVPHWQAELLNFGAQYFYRLVQKVSSQLIVFEQALANQLQAHLPTFVVPHYISKEPILEQKSARQLLGWQQQDIYCLYFGYLAPYKGILPLLQTWPTTAPLIDGRQVNLIVGGGINPNHAKQRQTLTYVKQVTAAAKAKNIPVTGFLPATKLPTYLSACDLMIFPYRTFLSSSGPLAMAFSYGKVPVLATPLKAYGESSDVAYNLKKAQVDLEKILFNPNSVSSLLAALNHAWHHQADWQHFGSLMLASRQLPQVAQATYQLLFPTH